MASALFGAFLLLVLWASAKLFNLVSSRWRHTLKTTKLRGPASPGWLLGLSTFVSQRDPDVSALYEEWAAQYGSVFELPVAFGRKKIVLTDPKAILHFYQSERAVYTKTENDRTFIGNIFGRGVLWAEGETHKRQRKALTPAFSNAAIRRLTAVFFDSAYKLKSFWDAKLEASSDGSATIEVQEWMNRVALDSVGIAGFSHDFGYLDGQSSPVTRAFEALQVLEVGIASELVFILSAAFPLLLSLPTERMRQFWELRRSLNVIAERLLENTRKEKEGNVAEELTDKSVIGLLLKSQMTTAELYMTQEEVVAQVRIAATTSDSEADPCCRWYVYSSVWRKYLKILWNVLLLAGYETTSVSLTWALIELAMHPEIQHKLRKELQRFNTSDPTWDQLVSTEIPYLDGVVQETLRLHPPITETLREAGCDDILPLSEPITTPSGELIDNITVAKGSVVMSPIRCINRSEAFWGPTAKEFIPERWFKDIDVPASQLQGHRHLMTFHDGPRTCLGKSFALAEFKSVLSVLIRNFAFEFESPDVVIDTHIAIVPRPKVAGQNGAKVPMKVKRVEM
ncbi:Cytochrome P450 [Mycena kentingensis (nom. inval.)]|nr:Cytochrome P450 [Mycena kentingensis (nom. inval.)]